MTLRRTPNRASFLSSPTIDAVNLPAVELVDVDPIGGLLTQPILRLAQTRPAIVHSSAVRNDVETICYMMFALHHRHGTS